MPHRTLLTPPIATAAQPAPAGQTALETLATRFRLAGMLLVGLDSERAVTFFDPASAPFFRRYALPLIQSHRSVPDAGAEAGTDFPCVPGVAMTLIPRLQKRQLTGWLLLAARSESFSIDEDVLRVCGQLGLDGPWLAQQARTLPGYNSDSIRRQGALLQEMLQDQARVSGLERELDTLSEQLANTYEELSLIYQVSSGMRVNRSADDFFKQVCLDVLDVMSVGAVGVALHDDANGRHEPVIYGRKEFPPGVAARLGESLLATLSERKAALLVNNLGPDRQLSWMAAHARHVLAVPLLRQEQVLGCLFALDKESAEFDSVDSKLLNSIANESAIYLENSRLFADVHGLMMGLLHSLTSAVDAKDAYTFGHSERVALVSRHLAKQAGLSEHDIEQIYMAALLHDVGKIGVPESVLQKTGRLTTEEFDQMKKHPLIGARILQDVRQIRQIIPGVLHHHERYDGKGYPGGLSGQNIPLMGRIICLADCFDAMTSNRTYRKALPLEVALTEIRRCSGTQFDPLLTEAFLRTSADEFRELLRNQQEKSIKFLRLQETLRGG